MNITDFANYLSINPISLYLIFIFLIVWGIVWKGIALWKASRNTDKVWYIALLIINTIGILEILYIFVFSKREYTPHIHPSTGLGVNKSPK